MDTINIDSFYDEGFNINDFIEQYKIHEVPELNEGFNIDDLIEDKESIIDVEAEDEPEEEFDIKKDEDDIDEFIKSTIDDSYSVEDLSNIYLDDSLYPGMGDLFPIFDLFKDDDLSFEVDLFKKKEVEYDNYIRKTKVSRYLNKKKNRKWGGRVLYPTLSNAACSRQRVRGKFVK